jgi:hypothetical protein
MNIVLIILGVGCYGVAVWSTMVSWNALRAMHRNKDPLLDRVGVRSPHWGLDCWRGIILLSFTSAGDELPKRVRLAMRTVCIGSVMTLVAGYWLGARA